MELTSIDLELLKGKGISEEKLAKQLKQLKEGFPYLKIKGPATLEDGIKKPTAEMQAQSIEIWDRYRQSGARIVKMVPASGAASRMFKDVFAFVNGKSDKPETPFMKRFFDEIEKFAFFHRLNFAVLQVYGKSIDSMIKEGRYKEIAEQLLRKEGLNYGQFPKALLHFHTIPGSCRTPIEEHLAEGAQYAVGSDGTVHVHFTVSEEHIPYFQRKIEEKKAVLSHKYGTDFDITMSIQKPSTDTVAANLDGTPYREKGKLFFRPGGHGALIENLNDIDADVVFLKNIDNVVPDKRRASTIEYKKVIAGILVSVKSTMDHYCKLLEKHEYDEAKLKEMLEFLRSVLCVTNDKADEMDDKQKAEYLMSKFNRPLRVCGMVKNEGEPGGGPFLCYNADGTVSPQILESSQIDPDNKEAVDMLKHSTHFNPVDLVVAIRNYKGEKFHLPEYVDVSTGFISTKSREGVEIKALELPGLWNGAMSNWNTILVEVPADTFNPVKTVNDLLRESHQ